MAETLFEKAMTSGCGRVESLWEMASSERLMGSEERMKVTRRARIEDAWRVAIFSC